MAFRFSCERLFAYCDHVYMWTLTFVTPCNNDKEAMHRLFLLCRHMKRKLPLLGGLRVVELHTHEIHFDATHGLHFHILISERIPYDRMKGWTNHFGFGIIHVTHCDNLGAALYLSKYLWKKNAIRFGARRWGAIGGFKPCKVKDVEYETSFMANKRELFGSLQLTFRGAMNLRCLTDIWGHWKRWPVPDVCQMFDSEFVGPGWRFTVEFETGGRLFEGSLTGAVKKAIMGANPNEWVRIWRKDKVCCSVFGQTTLQVHDPKWIARGWDLTGRKVSGRISFSGRKLGAGAAVKCPPAGVTQGN